MCIRVDKGPGSLPETLPMLSDLLLRGTRVAFSGFGRTNLV